MTQLAKRKIRRALRGELTGGRDDLSNPHSGVWVDWKRRDGIGGGAGILTAQSIYGLMAGMSARMIAREEVVTTPEVCDLLKITRQTLYAWMQRGRIKPWMKAGGASWLFVRSEVMKAKDLKYQRA